MCLCSLYEGLIQKLMFSQVPLRLESYGEVRGLRYIVLDGQTVKEVPCWQVLEALAALVTGSLRRRRSAKGGTWALWRG